MATTELVRGEEDTAGRVDTNRTDAQLYTTVAPINSPPIERRRPQPAPVTDTCIQSGSFPVFHERAKVAAGFRGRAINSAADVHNSRGAIPYVRRR